MKLLTLVWMMLGLTAEETHANICTGFGTGKAASGVTTPVPGV